MVHWAAILARRRSGDRRLPIVPLAGAALCLALAVFQAFAVREAGSVVVSWLAIGVILYLTTLASGARLADVSAEARDPNLARLRGRSPLVLVPIANPASAASLAGVAATVRTPGVGRVLLHSVVSARDGVPEEDDPGLRDAQIILSDSLMRGFERAVPAETLFTVASDPWAEIARVARLHGCQTIVLGSPRVFDPDTEPHLEQLISRVDAQAIVLRAPRRWRIAQVQSVLVPIGGRRDHSEVRAQLLASLTRAQNCKIIFLRTIKPTTRLADRRRAERTLHALARDEAEGAYEVLFEEAEDAVEAILRHASAVDLIVLGINQTPSGGGVFGAVVRAVAGATDTPLLMIGRQRGRSLRP
jgi:nucleotide-binding universal stress UspA family protein